MENRGGPDAIAGCAIERERPAVELGRTGIVGLEAREVSEVREVGRGRSRSAVAKVDRQCGLEVRAGSAPVAELLLDQPQVVAIGCLASGVAALRAKADRDRQQISAGGVISTLARDRCQRADRV